MGYEVLKDIKGYEGLYQVSNLGRVKSIRNDIILKDANDGNGYRSVALSVNGKPKSFKAHLLVAESFIRKSHEFLDVNHINGIRHDNRVENLEFVNTRENTSHGYKRKNTTSKYTGVARQLNRWRARINIDGKDINLGSFKSELDARDAYINALNKYNIKNKYV